MGLKTKAKKFMNLITMEERNNSYASELFADAVAPPKGNATSPRWVLAKRAYQRALTEEGMKK